MHTLHGDVFIWSQQGASLDFSNSISAFQNLIFKIALENRQGDYYNYLSFLKKKTDEKTEARGKQFLSNFALLSRDKALRPVSLYN